MGLKLTNNLPTDNLQTLSPSFSSYYFGGIVLVTII